MFRQLVITGAICLAISPCAKPQDATPTIVPVPASDDVIVTIDASASFKGDQISFLTSTDAKSCASSKTSVPLQVSYQNQMGDPPSTSFAVEQGSLQVGNFLCVVLKDSSGKVTASSPAVEISKPNEKAASAPCAENCYARTNLDYLLIGGIEQADLSAQSSVTEGFYNLSLLEPLPGKAGGLWFRSRYLGTPSSSSTQNIVAAATNPTGTLTTSNLPQTVTAVDYLIGYQFGIMSKSLYGGRLTLNPVVGFGGTSPLSATTVVSGFAVPAFGTNECNQLQSRFTTHNGYNPPLPSSGVDSSGKTDCVVMPNPASTPSNPVGGTQITNIGFSNEDRSDFLLKWGLGMRLTDRWFVKASDPTTYCNSETDCSRLLVDFTVGQDEAFTGGVLRHFVFKADAIVPIKSTGLYFFAASVNRFERNSTLTPLILSPVTLATNTSSSTCSPSTTTVCYPSPSVFILPYKQPDRDFYRIGIGIDAVKLLSKLFNPPQS